MKDIEPGLCGWNRLSPATTCDSLKGTPSTNKVFLTEFPHYHKVRAEGMVLSNANRRFRWAWLEGFSNFAKPWLLKQIEILTYTQVGSCTSHQHAEHLCGHVSHIIPERQFLLRFCLAFPNPTAKPNHTTEEVVAPRGSWFLVWMLLGVRVSLPQL